MATPLKDAGNAHLAAGRFEEALVAYDAALAAAEGKAAVLHANRAAVLLRIRRVEDALAAADAALAADGTYAKAIFRRAQALEALGRLGEAHLAVRRLLELDPRNSEAAAMLRRVHGQAAMRAATSGLSGASDAAIGLCAPGANDTERTAHARKLAAIASDRDRVSELLNCGAVSAMLSALPAHAQLATPAEHSAPHDPPASPVPEAAGSKVGVSETASSGARFEEVCDEEQPEPNAADAGGGGRADGATSQPSAAISGAGAAAATPSTVGSLGSLGCVGTLAACLDGLCSLLAAATPSPVSAALHPEPRSAADLLAAAQLRTRVLSAVSAEHAAALAHAALSAAEEAGTLGPAGAAPAGETGSGGSGSGIGSHPAAARARPDQVASPLPRLTSLALLLLARRAAAAAADDVAAHPARPAGSPSLDEEPPQPCACLLRGVGALAALTDRVRALPPSAEAKGLSRSCLDGWLVLAALPHALAAASLDEGARSAALRALLPFALSDRGHALSLLPGPRLIAPTGCADAEQADADGSQRHAALAALTPLLRARGPKGQGNEPAILAAFAKLCRPALDGAERAAAAGRHAEARAVRASVVELLAVLAELNRQAAARAALQQGLPASSSGWHALEQPKAARAAGAGAAGASDAADTAGAGGDGVVALGSDERFCLALCELYAHALAGSELLGEKDGAVVALTQLRLCVLLPSAPVRARAIVALAKAKAVHAQLRGSVVSLRALLNGTLALLTAAQPRAAEPVVARRASSGGGSSAAVAAGAAAAGLDLRPRSQLSTYRWAVEGLMYLVALGEAKALLLGLSEGAGLSSFKALATFLHQAHAAARARASAVAGGASTESPASLAAAAASATAVASLHYPLAWCVWRLVGGKELSEEEKKLQREMAPEQIAQFKKLAKGQNKAAGQDEADGDDESAYDPALLAALRARLVRDDGICLLAEVATQAGSQPHAASTRAACAKALLSLAELAEARGQLCAQGGFSACLQIANGPGADFGTPPGAPPRTDESASAKFDRQAAEAAAWALAKVAISTDPSLLPGAGGAASAQASLVRPLLRLLEVADHELPQFEAVMALTNLAAAGEEMQARLMREGTWRRLQLLLAEENPLLCRAAVECLANLATCDDALLLFTAHTSTDLKARRHPRPLSAAAPVTPAAPAAHAASAASAAPAPRHAPTQRERHAAPSPCRRSLRLSGGPSARVRPGLPWPPVRAQIFLGMCEAEDELTQQAAAGACATLASVPEVAAAMLHEENRSGMLEKVRPAAWACAPLLPATPPRARWPALSAVRRCGQPPLTPQLARAPTVARPVAHHPPSASAHRPAAERGQPGAAAPRGGLALLAGAARFGGPLWQAAGGRAAARPHACRRALALRARRAGAGACARQGAAARRRAPARRAAARAAGRRP